MTRRVWLDEGKQAEDRQRREPCGSACSSNAGVRAGSSRQVSDGRFSSWWEIVQGAVAARLCAGATGTTVSQREVIKSDGCRVCDQRRRSRAGDDGSGGRGKRRREGLCVSQLVTSTTDEKPSSFSTSPLLPVFCPHSLNQGTLPVGRMRWDRMDGVAQVLAVDPTMRIVQCPLCIVSIVYYPRNMGRCGCKCRCRCRQMQMVSRLPRYILNYE